jgi:hypothetical protein
MLRRSALKEIWVLCVIPTYSAYLYFSAAYDIHNYMFC